MPSELARERWLALEPAVAEALSKTREVVARFDETVVTNTRRSNKQRHALDQAINSLRRCLDLFAPDAVREPTRRAAADDTSAG